MPHISDVRAAKSAFQLSNVLDFVKQSAASTVGKGNDNAYPWDAVGDFLNKIIQEAGRIVPLSLEAENTLKSKLHVTVEILSLTILFSLWHRTMGSPH